jgi:hypothetical protein
VRSGIGVAGRAHQVPDGDAEGGEDRDAEQRSRRAARQEQREPVPGAVQAGEDRADDQPEQRVVADDAESGIAFGSFGFRGRAADAALQLFRELLQRAGQRRRPELRYDRLAFPRRNPRPRAPRM